MMPLATTYGKKTREVKWEYNLDKKKLIKKKIVGNLYMFINNIHSLRFIFIINEFKIHI